MNPQQSLFDIEQIAADQLQSQLQSQQQQTKDCLSPNTQELMKLLAQMGCNPGVFSLLFEMAQLPKELVFYMEGPVITHKSCWADTIPGWLLNAVYRQRMEQIFKELNSGKITKLATPAEVLCCIYPASFEGPLCSHWSDVYLWCGAQVIPTYNDKVSLQNADDFWAHVGSSPISFSRIKNDYEYIAWDIREKVVKNAASRCKKATNSVSAKPSKSSKKPEKEYPAVQQAAFQVNLFDI